MQRWQMRQSGMNEDVGSLRDVHHRICSHQSLRDPPLCLSTPPHFRSLCCWLCQYCPGYGSSSICCRIRFKQQSGFSSVRAKKRPGLHCTYVSQQQGSGGLGFNTHSGVHQQLSLKNFWNIARKTSWKQLNITTVQR